MEKITSQPVGLTPRPEKKWYQHLTLDLFIKVLNQTFLHPFIAWIVVLCLRAQATPTDHPSFIIAVGYATLLTLFTAARVLNHRLAYGTPREVDLSNEVIVVTGGGSGLGQLIAQIYGMRGASVAVLDIKEVGEVEGWDELSGVEYYQCDVSDRRALELTARRIEDDLGKPTVLINCLAAGINGQTILSLSPDAMKKTIRTNLLAPFHTFQVFLPGMITAENGGAIVTVSSVLGQLTAAGLADYSASKAGLSALHRTLEAELRASGLDEKIKLLLVETGQMCTPLFDGVETPNGFFAPVLEPIQVAYEIVSAVDKGTSGVIRLPAFAALVNWYAVLPASIQRLARYLSGIDGAIAKAFAGKTPRTQSESSSRSESDVEVIDAE
ncbi:hypothetical protein VTN96DRAFT_6733 [Rasamsonia emersonii]|uniref:Short-chain dehydrogenase/reductase family protein n=1 Tax=Rasamsonia emersonii (strain ATCC 16479 / CBS 393.64 / IMI 116815) TaxID=1408163 RepID=A0A0F4YJ79_RASE3|nr:Short-chain dehydrogenase/reductase family protein [Rasamsonia emersonii CBS 393.64]KKA18160.1 Short-chain dehydrogenase/reductase family protein [Rasamsonia emersonii CBS 393.64]